MSKKDKLIKRLKSRPADFKWSEMRTLLGSLGYREVKNDGSRRKFVHDTAPLISLHQPHPGQIVKGYAVKLVCELLEKEGMI